MRDLAFRVAPNAQRPLLPAVGGQGLTPNRQIGRCERAAIAPNYWVTR